MVVVDGGGHSLAKLLPWTSMIRDDRWWWWEIGRGWMLHCLVFFMYKYTLGPILAIATRMITGAWFCFIILYLPELMISMCKCTHLAKLAFTSIVILSTELSLVEARICSWISTITTTAATFSHRRLPIQAVHMTISVVRVNVRWWWHTS